jgi:hypothetical protein
MGDSTQNKKSEEHKHEWEIASLNSLQTFILFKENTLNLRRAPKLMGKSFNR